jgi:hypothetical protein
MKEVSGNLGAADPGLLARETAERAEWKRERDAELKKHRLDASRDKRVFRTHARVFLAYIRLARSPLPRLVTVTALCKESHVSEAAFHKNFKSGVQGLLLATMEQIFAGCRRMIRLEVGKHEAKIGQKLSRAERVTIAIHIFVRTMTRYPHLFNIEGILPREVMYLAGDVLADALIWDWNDPTITPTEKAEFVAVAKYHATALIGIMRSSLGEHIDHPKYVARVIHLMGSQLLPSLTAENVWPELYELARDLRDPLPLRVPEARAYRQLLALKFAS